MRLIEISTEVFAAIWAMRCEGEEDENSILRRVLAEAKQQQPKALGREQANLKEGVEMFGKVRWVDDIITALRELGGEATLRDIYDAVRLRRKVAGRSVTREYKATIRRTLEDHSSDSANHRADDLFALIDRGVWALR